MEWSLSFETELWREKADMSKINEVLTSEKKKEKKVDACQKEYFLKSVLFLVL